MDVREKLMEIVKKAAYSSLPSNTEDFHLNMFVTNLLSNGVTVQECGEWVYDHWCEFKCSVCGEFSTSEPYRGKENYCPNCGAIMDGKCKESAGEE